MPIPLEMTYFYLLHFVIEICKQQQMPSQFTKAFGDALRLFRSKNFLYFDTVALLFLFDKYCPIIE